MVPTPSPRDPPSTPSGASIRRSCWPARVGLPGRDKAVEVSCQPSSISCLGLLAKSATTELATRDCLEVRGPVDCDFGGAFGVASSFEGLDKDGPPDGASWRESLGDDLVRGREGKIHAGPDPLRQIQDEPVLLQHPSLQPVLSREEMSLRHPCQRPSGPLQQGAYLRVLLHRELPSD